MRRDVFLDEIQQVGKVLGKILGDFLGFKSKGYITQGIVNTKQQLQSELDIDLFELLDFTETEMQAFVIEKKMTEGHLEILSELLFEIGASKIDRGEANQFLNKAIEVSQMADIISSTLSYNRQQRVLDMMKKLNF